MAKKYKTISISCKAKDLLDEIAKVAAINRSAFIEKLIEKEHSKLVKEEEK